MRRVLMTLARQRKEYARCDRCGRIMFPRRDGTLPLHKKPAPPRPPHPGKGAHMPLTGPEAPWCREED